MSYSEREDATRRMIYWHERAYLLWVVLKKSAGLKQERCMVDHPVSPPETSFFPTLFWHEYTLFYEGFSDQELRTEDPSAELVRPWQELCGVRRDKLQ